MDSPPSVAVESTSAEKTSDGALVKVTFVNQTVTPIELNCMATIELVKQLGKVLDMHRTEMREEGGS